MITGLNFLYVWVIGLTLFVLVVAAKISAIVRQCNRMERNIRLSMAGKVLPTDPDADAPPAYLRVK